jgi:glyoxylase-like metal-dependent hydrolase (beta-lactamase superfamily II)/rhodanese-related sulfurtransferase
LSSRELLDVFDSAGVRLSAGSACSSASVEPSYVLDAMGVPEWRSISAVRLSFGPLTSEEEVERGCRAIREAAMALQGSCLLQTGGGYEAPEGLRDGVIQLRSGPANTWIVADKAARTCAVIDPTETTVERIVNYIRCQGLRVMAVLDTHSHADHDSTRPLLLRALEDQLSEGAQNGDALGWPAQTERAPLADGSEAEVLVFSPTRWLARVATPGHTSDSVKFLWGEGGVQELRSQHAVRFAFVGDTVWSGGLGRTNFAMSDATALYHSLHKLTAILGESTLLCSAHDYDTSFATTLALEARENPLLQKVVSEALDEFVAEKARLDEQLAELERSFQGVMCGVTAERAKQDEQALKLQLSQALKESNLEWIDVREPHEHVLFKGWREAGILNPPRNVPLSRFVNFMQEALRKDSASRKFVLVCRSGNRSLQAAKTLRRMGHSQVWSLDGGVATL